MRITLCGSTRFIEDFRAWNTRLTRAGHTVYSVSERTSTDESLDPEVKLVLDAVHMGKIENSDAIFVITRPIDTTLEPYIGESTAREIHFARVRGKTVFMDRLHGDRHEFATPLNHLLRRTS